MENTLSKSEGLFLPLMIVSLATICIEHRAFGQTTALTGSPDSYQSVLREFQDPSAEYRSAPLWVWNDRMTREQIDEQLADFKAHGIGGVFIHPRPGLITPYLSEEWFSLCRYAVDVGKKLGMKIWLYDENSYPSGFAGGHVPAQMPDAVRTGLRMVKVSELPKGFDSEPLLVLMKNPSGFLDIMRQARSGSFGTGEYYIFSLNKQQPNPWYGGYTYVDLMRRGVTEKFLDVTLNAYKRAIGDEFGNVVPGVFQDEAEVAPAGGRDIVVVNYTPALFDRFRSKWGYDLKSHLPSLYEEVGDWERVRHNYYATILDLFIEGWAKPYYEYCTKNNLLFTGHYWEHEWPRPVINPDNMAMAAFSHMPGIDILMNEFQMDTHAQFGNTRAVKEIRSIANQLGQKRTMSETFGAGGWEMSFFDQKRIADWEYALGVNFMNQHLSYATIKGARKRDHPLSFSYHEPWWHAYKPMADYFGRLSIALSSGEQLNRVVVIEPTTTAWMYHSPRGESEKMKAIGKRFQDFVNRLEAAHVEYDLASESIIREHAKVKDEKFHIGQRAYELVILPPGLENLDRPTLLFVIDYVARGGRIICYGKPPSYVDGRKVDEIEMLAAKHPRDWLIVEDDDDLEMIGKLIPPHVELRVKNTAGDSPNLLFHHRRSLADCELLFLVNTSNMQIASGTIVAPGRSCEQWDLATGRAVSYPYTIEKNKLSLEFSLPPVGSLLLCVRPMAGKAGKAASVTRTELKASGLTTVERVSQNVLTLDYCDLTLDGKTHRDLYFYAAQLKTFQFHGLDRNPWDNGVQYEKSILDKDKFASGSGFEVAYQFTVAEGVDSNSLQVVVERPELYQVSVNGNRVSPLDNVWWLDKSFGVFEIGRFVRPGENRIVLKASPFTIHTELEPVYVIGNFALKSQQRGFLITPSSNLKTGSWAGQGMPLYGGGVTYTREYSVSTDRFDQERFFVELGRWSGVVAEVQVNGKQAGFIAFAPFEIEVTDHIRRGKNNLTVTVYGSLKNTLGPHHNSPPLGRAWPGMFQQGAKDGYPPGSAYSVVDYGLFDDFRFVVQSR